MSIKHYATKILMFSVAALLVATLVMAKPTFSDETDRIALLAFKRWINEDPLGALSSWNTSIDVHVCLWHGIKCGLRHHRVVELNLSSQKLVGTISPFIGNLSFLRSINLHENFFRGVIPPEISHLPRLRSLNLSDNNVQGLIPTNFSLDIRVISLSFNGLVGEIPVAFGSLSSLRVLYLAQNSLHGIIPPSLGNLTELQYLLLGNNKLEGIIPESIVRIRNLEWLDIAENNIHGIVPPPLYNISTLKAILFSMNNLRGSLPWDIGLKLPNLREFGIGFNHFTGSFPSSFSNASRLEWLELNANGFSGLVPGDIGERLSGLENLNLDDNYFHGDLHFVDSLTNCTKLQYLSFRNNSFGGVLPSSIVNLSEEFTLLAAGTNQLVGAIPDGISKLVGLTTLGLEENHLSGSIPDSIGVLPNLQRLVLGTNRLSGTIPESISNLSQILHLYLEVNLLTGNFPRKLENFRSLQILNLRNNHLSGSVPKAIGILSSIVGLDLSYNSFSGSLPYEIGSLNNLEELDIIDNDLSGELPTALGNCLKLELLYLGSNSFHGKIPSSLASLRGLMQLDLSCNNFSGRIPVNLEKLPFLVNLNLSFNNLEGEVPLRGGFSNMSAISVVGNKDLCGGIPQLKLPACLVQESTKHNNHLGFKVIISTTAAGLCLVMLLISVALYWKKKSTRASTTTPLGEEFIRVSYNDLFKATNGFSSDNLLGVGSFGHVYRGMLKLEQNQNEKQVAVKIFNLERLGAPESFISECEVLRKTRHRNLLKVITACSSIDFQGRDFKALVYEFMSNGSLDSWLQITTTRTLSFTQRLQIAIDVVSGLEYLHHQCEKPIIHCDLKPSNVLLNEDMIAHVGDFGLARFVAVDTSNPIHGQTNSIAIKGSIGYIAPEYGMGQVISAQGDIYSIGILVLEMFTGKRPTDEMFEDGINLHHLCKMALPDKVMEIIDQQLLTAEESVEDRTKARMRECLTSLIRLGVACSTESTTERMGEITDIAVELDAIKKRFLGSGK